MLSNEKFRGNTSLLFVAFNSNKVVNMQKVSTLTLVNLR